MQMDKILIVENDYDLAQKLCGAFIDNETAAVSCGSINAAVALAEDEYFNMVIVDELLPDGNSIDYIKKLKTCNSFNSISKTSVIMIVPDELVDDIETAQENGADDCITKPFSTAALKARVATQLKKHKWMYNFEASKRFDAIGTASIKGIRGEHMVAIDKYMFDFDKMEFRCMGEGVELNGIEEKLLRILIENKGVVLRKEALIERMRSETDMFIDRKILADAITTLRDKLDAAEYIKAIYGIGYMWSTNID